MNGIFETGRSKGCAHSKPSGEAAVVAGARKLRQQVRSHRYTTRVQPGQWCDHSWVHQQQRGWLLFFEKREGQDPFILRRWRQNCKVSVV